MESFNGINFLNSRVVLKPSTWIFFSVRSAMVLKQCEDKLNRHEEKKARMYKRKLRSRPPTEVKFNGGKWELTFPNNSIGCNLNSARTLFPSPGMTKKRTGAEYMHCNVKTKNPVNNNDIIETNFEASIPTLNDEASIPNLSHGLNSESLQINSIDRLKFPDSLGTSKASSNIISPTVYHKRKRNSPSSPVECNSDTNRTQFSNEIASDTSVMVSPIDCVFLIC